MSTSMVSISSIVKPVTKPRRNLSFCTVFRLRHTSIGPTVVLHIKRVVSQAEILGGSDGARTRDLRRDTPVEQALAPRQRRCTIR